jgi:hypothetical protein
MGNRQGNLFARARADKFAPCDFHLTDNAMFASPTAETSGGDYGLLEGTWRTDYSDIKGIRLKRIRPNRLGKNATYTLKMVHWTGKGHHWWNTTMGYLFMYDEQYRLLKPVLQSILTLMGKVEYPKDDTGLDFTV